MKKLWLIFFFIPFTKPLVRALPIAALLTRPPYSRVDSAIFIRFSSVLSSLIHIFWIAGHPGHFGKKYHAGPLTAISNLLRIEIVEMDTSTRYVRKTGLLSNEEKIYLIRRYPAKIIEI